MFPFTTGESIFLFCVLEFSDVIEAILLLSLNLLYNFLYPWCYIWVLIYLKFNLFDVMWRHTFIFVLSPAPSSVQFCRSVMSDSLRPHGLQNARPPCPSPTPGVYPNSCPLGQWCHLIISSSVFPFSSCLQSSQHQGLFKWVSSSHQVVKILEFSASTISFQWTPRTDFL